MARFSLSFFQLALTFAMIALLPALDFEAQIIINEASPFKGLTDGVGQESDWIELLNVSNLPVDLTGYHLSDNADNWDKWEIPELVLQPDERTIILASGDDKPYLADDWQSLVVETDVWRYLPGYFQPPVDWNTLDFDDITWNLGPGGFGYGDDDDNTQITNADSYYLRKTFELESID
ncbi:MAG: lamin tail domain-containing protein, partial [Flavobacteriales bacterium]